MTRKNHVCHCFFQNICSESLFAFECAPLLLHLVCLSYSSVHLAWDLQTSVVWVVAHQSQGCGQDGRCEEMNLDRIFISVWHHFWTAWWSSPFLLGILLLFGGNVLHFLGMCYWALYKTISRLALLVVVKNLCPCWPICALAIRLAKSKEMKVLYAAEKTWPLDQMSIKDWVFFILLWINKHMGTLIYEE